MEGKYYYRIVRIDDEMVVDEGFDGEKLKEKAERINKNWGHNIVEIERMGMAQQSVKKTLITEDLIYYK